MCFWWSKSEDLILGFSLMHCLPSRLILDQRVQIWFRFFPACSHDTIWKLIWLYVQGCWHSRVSLDCSDGHLRVIQRTSWACLQSSAQSRDCQSVNKCIERRGRGHWWERQDLLAYWWIGQIWHHRKGGKLTSLCIIFIQKGYAKQVEILIVRVTLMRYVWLFNLSALFSLCVLPAAVLNSWVGRWMLLNIETRFPSAGLGRHVCQNHRQNRGQMEGIHDLSDSQSKVFYSLQCAVACIFDTIILLLELSRILCRLSMCFESFKPWRASSSVVSKHLRFKSIFLLQGLFCRRWSWCWLFEQRCSMASLVSLPCLWMRPTTASFMKSAYACPSSHTCLLECVSFCHAMLQDKLRRDAMQVCTYFVQRHLGPHRSKWIR